MAVALLAADLRFDQRNRGANFRRVEVKSHECASLFLLSQ